MGVRTLPAPLPCELVKLNCSLNKLTLLPTPLPPTLKVLIAFNNHIDTLPLVWPAALQHLDLGQNRLTSLAVKTTTFPPKVHLICLIQNQLTELPRLNHLAQLRRFNCGQNTLHTLALNHLPATLEFLSCSHSQIQHCTGTFPAHLKYLYISNNQLTALPLPLPPQLVEVELQHNCLTTLGGALPPKVKYFTCNNNQFESLPLLPESLKHINSLNNPIFFRPLCFRGQIQEGEEDHARLNEYIYMYLAKQRMKHNDFRWFLLFHSANICMHPKRIEKLVSMNILSFTDDSFSAAF